jgi:periplasmic protein TonB
MSRRRRKNPILMRALAISFGVNLILLPVLAYFGAFKKISSEFHEATVILVNKPEDKQTHEKTPPAKKTEAKKDTGKGPQTPHHGVSMKPNPVAPKVETAGAGPGGDGGGPAVESGTGKAGTLPSSGSGISSSVPKAVEPAPRESAPAAAAPKPLSPAPVTAPQPAKPIERPKHIPVYREPAIAYGPQPTIPDDLRDEALDKSFVAEFSVGADGVPTNVKTAQSTGIAELDDIALEAARKWRFKPAMLDGASVDSRVRLIVEFKVE